MATDHCVALRRPEGCVNRGPLLSLGNSDRRGLNPLSDRDGTINTYYETPWPACGAPLNNWGGCGNTFIGNIGGSYPTVGSYHTFKVWYSHSANDIRITFDGNIWTTADTPWDPKNAGAYTWPDFVSESADEQQYLEGGMLGCPYPNRVDFSIVQEWDGSNWTSNSFTGNLNYGSPFARDDTSTPAEFFTYDTRC